MGPPSVVPYTLVSRALGKAWLIWASRLSLTGADPMRMKRTDDRSVRSIKSFSRSIIAIIGGTEVSHVTAYRSIAAT